MTETHFHASISKEYFLECLATHLIGYLEIEKTCSYQGYASYGTFYWYGCKVYNSMFEEFYKCCEDAEILKILTSHQETMDNYDHLDLFIMMNEIIDQNFNSENIIGWLDSIKEQLHDIRFTNFIYDIEELYYKWRRLFQCYERLTEATAKATIIKALYNPNTQIGKIHVNALYDENF